MATGDWQGVEANGSGKFLWVPRETDLQICLVFSFPGLLGILMIWIQFVATERTGIMHGVNNEMCRDTVVCVCTQSVLRHIFVKCYNLNCCFIK